MSNQTELFSILPKVDSSNNYAMDRVRAGLAKHGQAWFALDQFGGRGQRDKTWYSLPGENLVLSISVRPGKAFIEKPFLLSMLTAIECRRLFAEYAGKEVTIKWPNDIYWRDRKTAGILIENVFKGKEWNFAVIGIGMNINQEYFGSAAANAISLINITGKVHDPLSMARELHQRLVKKIEEAETANLVKDYNEMLYKKK